MKTELKTDRSPKIERVAHELKVRMLKVKKVQDLTPRLRRITLTGDDLTGFKSLSPDDHVKVFFPRAGESTPLVPVPTPDGVSIPDGAIARDYTPRFYRPDSNELDLDFFLHEGGIGASWARDARPGALLGVAGPRGSLIVPYEFDWYLFFSDEAGIPSISRRLSELPEGSKARAFIEVAGAHEEIKFDTKADLEVKWLHRENRTAGTPDLFKEAILSFALPEGLGFSWIMTELACAKELEALLLTRGAKKDFIKATGYWKKARP